MSKIKQWAARKSGPTISRYFSDRPIVQAPAPSPIVNSTGHPIVHQQTIPAQQPAAGFSAPAPRPALVQLAQGTIGNRGPVESIDPVPPPNQLVKIDAEHGDPFENFMAGVEDIAKSAGVTHEGPDAMDMTGVPQFGAMEKWTPSARYFNKVTDSRNDGDFTGYRQKRDQDLLREANRR